MAHSLPSSVTVHVLTSSFRHVSWASCLSLSDTGAAVWAPAGTDSATRPLIIQAVNRRVMERPPYDARRISRGWYPSQLHVQAVLDGSSRGFAGQGRGQVLLGAGPHA